MLQELSEQSTFNNLYSVARLTNDINYFSNKIGKSSHEAFDIVINDK